MSMHGYPADMSIFCNLQLGLLELQDTPQADIDQDKGRIRLVKFRPTILGSVHPRTDKMLLTETVQSNGKFCPRSNWKHYLD